MRINCLVVSFLILSVSFVFGQTPIKNANNSFALYNKNNQFSDLENAKKFIDEAYKTKKDSASKKNRLTRCLIYSALSFADSTRKLSYAKDPIDETLYWLERLSADQRNEKSPEIEYIRENLANAFLKKANNALNSYNNEDAYDAFRWVDSLGSGNIPLVKHNLALLSQKIGYRSRAIAYFEQLLRNPSKTIPEYYLTLASLYRLSNNENKALDVIVRGKAVFPKNEDLLLNELNTYLNKSDYQKIAEVIPALLEFIPDNINLNYIAAFAFDVTGKISQAENFYKKVIRLDQNNYDATYSLGLLYFKLYTDSSTDKENLFAMANLYLNKAYEINPNAINVLKSLTLLYTKSNDKIKLEQINKKLNQLIIN